MKPKIAFFGSDQYSEIVFNILKDSQRFEVAKAPPAHLNIEKIVDQVKKFQPDIGVLASYGKILPKKLLVLPKHGILNIHPSILPLYRGPTPVPTAILNGDKVTGVSIIKMDGQIDHGPILAQFKMEIFSHDTGQDLLKRCFCAGAQVLVTILPAYLEGQIEHKNQNHAKATLTQKFTRKSGKIDWKKDSLYNERFIRAMHPWPGAWTKIELRVKNKELRIKRLKIHKAHLEKSKLVLDQVQLEGKKPVTWKQFCQGYPEAKLV